MKRILSIISLGLALFIDAQTLSTAENYIYTKTCLDETCTKKSEAVQYVDGFGRNKQIISIGATPSGKDIVQHIEYDNYDRQARSYFPIPQQGSQGGAIYSSPLSNVGAVYGSEKIYSENIFQNDISGQIKQVIPAGNAWASHPLKLAITANSSGDQVRKITVVTSWINNATSYTLIYNPDYASNQLSKSIVIDGDGSSTTEFRNSSGKTVLIRKNDGSKTIDTYYLYDEFGNLAFVVPPLASVGVSASAPITTSVLDNLCYQYRYDGQGRIVEKKLPGTGWEYSIYDQQDRMIMSQDAKLRTNDNTFSAKGWMFTKYDKWGRMLYSGFFPNADSRITLQNNVNNITVNAENNESRNDASFTSNGMQVFYTQNAFPTGNLTILGVNYYDTYPAYGFNPSFPVSIFGQNVITDTQTVPISTKGLPTLSLVKNIEDNNWTKSYAYYNTKGMAVGSHSINHLGGYTRSEIEFDFAGVAKQAKVYHKRLNTDTERTISQVFEYDDKNRLKKVWHQVGSQPQELLAESTYNELSQIINKKVGNNLQSIDYAYDLRGALVKMNNPAQLGTKLFGFELKYTNPQNTANSPAKYNGNITEVTWKTATDNVLRQYNYQYDTLNRLKKGIYSEPNASLPQNGFYNETVEYDLGGNITSIKRNTGMSSVASLMDDLTYNYTGNRLNSVIDGSNNYSGYPDVSGNVISYDDNGNMKDHIDKGILKIDYNFMNLPNYVKFDTEYKSHDNADISYNVNTKYLYSADGSKLRKVYTYGSGRAQFETANIVDYLDGFQYEGDDIVGSSLQVPALKFIPTAEGYYDFENNRYIYNYTDHLGNIRLSYFKNTSGSAEALEENNYYPFGLKHLGYNNVGGNPPYNYQYNGKELQKETGWIDYGARMYMADIGRWGVIDPLAETSSRFSPYHYAANNPVSFIDPDGRKAVPAPYEGMENHLVEGSYMWQMAGGTFNPHQKVPNGSGGTSSGGGSEALISKMLGLGGNWTNTGSGFKDTDGISLGYNGGYQSLNSNFTEGGIGEAIINIPSVELSGSFAIEFGLKLRNHVNDYMSGWNAQSNLNWKKLTCGHCFDGPVNFIGSAGDPAGVFDIGGQVMSTWKPQNRYLAMAAGVLAAVALKKPGIIAAEESNLWRVGAYKEMQGIEKGLDAHHVGQSALMKRLVEGYDHKSAPTILVPTAGHRKLIPEIGRMEITRGPGNFTNARQVLARDIFELRRVYGNQGIPNSALKELIQMNKNMYPKAFMK